MIDVFYLIIIENCLVFHYWWEIYLCTNILLSNSSFFCVQLLCSGLDAESTDKVSTFISGFVKCFVYLILVTLIWKDVLICVKPLTILTATIGPILIEIPCLILSHFWSNRYLTLNVEATLNCQSILGQTEGFSAIWLL